MLYVRARLRLDRGRPAGARAVHVGHAAALAVACGLAAIGPAPWLAPALFVVLLARSGWGLSPGRGRVRPQALGWQELGYGTLTLAMMRRCEACNLHPFGSPTPLEEHAGRTSRHEHGGPMTRKGLVWPVLPGSAIVAALVPVPLLSPATPSAAQEAWTQTSTAGAPSAREEHTAVWTGSRMIVWGGFDGRGYLNTGGVYDPLTRAWTATSTMNAPTARCLHTAVWTGSKMIVWGGLSGFDGHGPLDTGGIYDPASDTWKATTMTKAPSARYAHTAVWTGSRMIVWGGFDYAGGGVAFGSGGIYDPATDAWTATSTTSAPSARWSHTAVWSVSGMIVWGGTDVTRLLGTGGIYDPATDAWKATSTTNAPSAREYHTAIWTGSRMIVWGGFPAGDADAGGIYDPATGTWKATSTTSAPGGRRSHTAVWTGSRMIAWGGFDGYDSLDSGGIYDPATDAWTATSTVDAPTARSWHTAVWTGSMMIVWGGYFRTSVLNTGGVYSNPAVLPPPPPAADFFTVTPCRVVDTRNAAGPTGGPALAPGATRSFPMSGGACGVPSTSRAVSVNATVVQPGALGRLVLYAGDAASPPLTSSINFSPGVTRANNAIVRLASDGGTVYVNNASAGSVHFVLDVTGYFR